MTENLLEGKTIVLIAPQFFKYETHMKAELEAIGATVLLFDERPANNFIDKVLIRINRNFLDKKIKRHYQNILNDLSRLPYSIDYLFIVNPEAMDTKILQKLKKATPSAFSILYMWDSFDNKKASLHLLPYFDRKMTFDQSDAIKYNMNLRPLFFIAPYNNAKIESNFDLCFSGTAHSDRFNLVQRVKFQIQSYASIRSYFFLSSRWLFYLKKILERQSRTIPLSEISFDSLSHEENAFFMSQAKCILDINHPKQVGLTMRTFETIGLGRKLITTNINVKKYDFYDERNVLVIDRDNPKIPLSFIESPFIPYDPQIVQRYHIRGWIQDVFRSNIE